MKAFLAILLLTGSLPLFGQWLKYPTPGLPRTKDGKPNLTAPAPKGPDGHPDLSGIWSNEGTAKSGARGAKQQVGPNLLDYMADGAEVPFTPEGAALYKMRSENLGKGRPSEHCLPHSIPDAMTVSVFKIVPARGVTMILFEEFNHFRQIFTDGRPLPPPGNPAWFGYSIGRWEGNAFVVETSGFNDKSWLDDYGHPHSEELRTTERFVRRDVGHMDMTLTVTDPKYYTRPWSATLPFRLNPDTDLIEDICDNEKDVQHQVGK